ncbi:hypothetical protein GQ457_12G008060 [Hibiscus cannabinus]
MWGVGDYEQQMAHLPPILQEHTGFLIPTAMKIACIHPTLLRVPSFSKCHLEPDTFLLAPLLGHVNSQQTVALTQEVHLFLQYLGLQAQHLSLDLASPIAYHSQRHHYYYRQEG